MLLHTEDLHETFPNVSIATRMFMSLMVTNCSGERSFSRMGLGLIKNKLRSSMTDDRLSAMEILSVESDLLDQICKKQKVPIMGKLTYTYAYSGLAVKLYIYVML